MDKETFEALKRVTKIALNQAHNDADIQNDLRQVWAWMAEVEKEIEDVETLGSDHRPPLTPIN